MPAPEASSAVAGLAHVNIRVPEGALDTLRDFYRDIIGLHEGPRPNLRSQGHWMYAGEQDVVHLSVDMQPDEQTIATGSPFNHMAFACHGLAATLQRLQEASIPFRLKHIEAEQQVQVFLADPAGVGIELNFRGETPPA